MRKLKIGIVCYPSVGGSGIIATELGKLMAARGHQIHFISSSIPFRLNRRYQNIYFHQAEANQYAVFQYTPYSLSLASKIAEIVKREKLDIIHAHYAIPHAVCGILAKQMTTDHLKVITTLHGTDITVLGQDPSMKEVIKFGIEKSDYVVAVSESLRLQTYEELNPDQEIETVYNFINPLEFKKVTTNLKAELGIAENEKVVLHVSNFRKIKRIDQIVRAFAKTFETVPAKLLLVGDGPEWSTIYQLVIELGIEDAVLMLGKQENLHEIYSIADAFMLLSEKESFGVVLLEAMACGVPCIGTDVGGIPEVISHNENGFVVALDDLITTSERLKQLLTDDQLHQMFSQNAITTVTDKFSAKKACEHYEKLYYQLLEADDSSIKQIEINLS